MSLGAAINTQYVLHLRPVARCNSLSIERQEPWRFPRNTRRICLAGATRELLLAFNTSYGENLGAAAKYALRVRPIGCCCSLLINYKRRESWRCCTVCLAVATRRMVLLPFNITHSGESVGAGTQYVLRLRPVGCCCSRTIFGVEVSVSSVLPHPYILYVLVHCRSRGKRCAATSVYFVCAGTL